MSGTKRRLEKLEAGVARQAGAALDLYGDQSRPASVKLLACLKILADAPGLPADMRAPLAEDVTYLTAYVAGEQDPAAEAQYAADLDFLRGALRDARR